MHDVEVKKTHSFDFEKIYPLLKEFNSPYTHEEWYRIFSYKWDGAEDYIGFHLEHKGQVVGFMGLIFSCRYKNDHRYKFCNITSLIVKDGYRAATIFLVRKLKLIENTIYTGLRPIQESYRLFKMIGFADYESYYKIIPTINCFFGIRSKLNVYEFPELLDRVDSENRRIVIDHRELKCQKVVLEIDGSWCLIIYKSTIQNYYKMALKKVHILYISDASRFNKNIHNILSFFKKKFGFLSAIYVDSRFLYSQHLVLSIAREIKPPRICSNQYRDQIDMDELYSESVLL